MTHPIPDDEPDPAVQEAFEITIDGAANSLDSLIPPNVKPDDYDPGFCFSDEDAAALIRALEYIGATVPCLIRFVRAQQKRTKAATNRAILQGHGIYGEEDPEEIISSLLEKLEKAERAGGKPVKAAIDAAGKPSRRGIAAEFPQY
jgi:hypothetical protein